MADLIWLTMGELYTTKWTKRNGDIASDLWLEALGTLTDEQIQLGMDKCKQKIFKGDYWAPDLSEFLALIHGHSSIDFHSAFLRCLNKNPEGRIEQWVHENAGYNIRVSSNEKAERMHKKYMMEAIDRDNRGDLILNEDRLIGLPQHSVKSVTDLAREKYEAKNGKKLNPRIKAILDKNK
jgi:hypothetical protein